jgi:hypothetical protein
MKPWGKTFMSLRKLSGPSIVLALLGLMLTLFAPSANAQADRLDATFARLRQTEKRLGPNVILSGGARSLFALAHNWDRTKTMLARAAEANLAAQATSALMGGAVSGPLDFSITRMGGFTQNESSTAWCGKNVVIGFNDTGSLYPSFFARNGGLALLGYSTSSNKGATFTDRGYPTAPTDPAALLFFDQVFTCTSSQNFYYSTLYEDSANTAVSVSVSTDGGVAFGPPVVVSSASNASHFFDGDWMAVNPANPNQLFVTYTDNDFSGARCGTGIFGNTIELVWSNDGGTTWSSPSAVTEVCNDPAALGGTPAVEESEVTVDPTGKTVYVSWEYFGKVLASAPFTLPREVDIAKATIPGTLAPLSFGGAAKVSDINYVGGQVPIEFGESAGVEILGGLPSVQVLQGRILTYEHPKLAIGRGPQNAGTLYVAWNDGDHPIWDLLTYTCMYQFSDILLSSSTDGANSWSAPVRVNNNFEDGTPAHPFTDQFRPALATDKNGKIGVCYYDRSQDPNNFLLGRTCAVSLDGSKWTKIPIASPGGPSVVNQDLIPFGLHDWLGDYEALASDSLNQSVGFIGGYTDISAGYQNIQENKF